MQQQSPGAAPVCARNSSRRAQIAQVIVPAQCHLGDAWVGMMEKLKSHRSQEKNRIRPKSKLLVWAGSGTSLLQHCQPWAHKNRGVKTSKSWNKKIKKLKKIEPAYGRLLLFGTTRFGKCRSCVFKPFPFLLLKQGGLQLCCYFCKTRSENPLMLWFKNTRLLPNMAQEEFLFTFAPQCPQVCLCK